MDTTEVFQILRYGFDNMENHIAQALYVSDLGIVVGNDMAVKVVEELKETYGNTYKGWDGEIYPQYVKKKLSPFLRTKLNKFGNID